MKCVNLVLQVKNALAIDSIIKYYKVVNNLLSDK
jgi:hypothetical protein